MNAMVDSLVASMPPEDVFPTGVMRPLLPFVRGVAFFPGGSGLFGGAEQPIAPRPIMVVGQDFGTTEYVDEMRASGATSEDMGSTWNGLLDLFLGPSGIDPRDCFFTNTLMGARCIGGMTGPNPALDHDQFMLACESFMKKQITVVQPSVVIALGVIPAALLSRWLGIARELARPRRAKPPRIAELDDLGLQFVEGIRLSGLNICFDFGWSIHPANGKPNLRHRSWKSVRAAGEAANTLVWCRARESRIAAVTMSSDQRRNGH